MKTPEEILQEQEIRQKAITLIVNCLLNKTQPILYSMVENWLFPSVPTPVQAILKVPSSEESPITRLGRILEQCDEILERHKRREQEAERILREKDTGN